MTRTKDLDTLSFRAPAEDTQKKMPLRSATVREGKWVEPAWICCGRAVGEIVIIGVTDTTATGMIVFAMEDVHAGDDVELDQVN
jgi:hypothetical protein